MARSSGGMLSALDDPACPWCETSLTTARAGNRRGGSWHCIRCERTFTPGPVTDTAVGDLLLEHTDAYTVDSALIRFDVRRDRLVVVDPDGRAELRVDAYAPSPEPGTKILDLPTLAARCNAALP